MHFLYIIYSKSIDSFYVGETHDIDKRLTTHNDHGYSKGFTKAANDWAIALKFECNSKEDALYLERFIKRMKSRTFINKIVQNNLDQSCNLYLFQEQDDS